MPKMELDLPVKDIEKDYQPSGFMAGVDSNRLRYGENILPQAYSNIVTSYDDYNDNKEAYDAFTNVDTFTNFMGDDDIKRKTTYEMAIENGRYMLDDDGRLSPGPNHFMGADLLYNTKAIHGALLAKRNGFNNDVLNNEYGNITELKAEELAEIQANSSGLTFALGYLGQELFRKETIVDVMSPQKIMGSTVLKGAAKAFGVEAMYATTSEVMRERQAQEHMEKAGLDYTLWDSVENILIGAGLAGAIRGIGSSVQDIFTLRKINSKIRNVEDKALFERYTRRENFKLTRDSRKHLALEEKAVRDIDEGRAADVADHTDIDINTKTDEAIEAVNINDEVAKANPVNHDDIKAFERELDEVAEVKDPTEADPYGGMVEPKVADETINEVIDDPEIKALYDEIEAEKKALSGQAQAVKEAGEIPVGGSEDQANQAVKDMFKRAKTEDDFYKSMSQEQIDELDRIKMEDPDLQVKQKEIEDELNAFASEQAGVGGTSVFTQFGPELFGGAWNGITYDSETNSFEFDPLRFMFGFLGGHLAKKIATNPKLNAVAKREALAYAQRMHDKLEDTRYFQYVTGVQKAIDDRGVKAIPEASEAINKTTRDANFKEWFSDSKVVDYNGEPEVVYHGTTHNIGEFSMDRANPENWHGKGFYFSDSIEDVNRNYGTMEGADLTGRIEQIAERRADDIMDEQDIDDWDEAYEIAKKEATKEISGERPNVMPVYVKAKNPLELDAYGGTEFEIKLFDDEGEYLYEAEGDGAELLQALRDKIDEYGGESDTIVGQLYEMFQDAETFTAKEFEDALRGIEEFSYIEGPEGELINHQIIADVYQEMGFDGIIMRNAEDQFSNMGMNPDTTHYIVFEPNQIKSVNNKGAFSKDGNILKSAMIVPAVGAGGLATAQQSEGI